jgi:hypothetical protein
MVLHWPLPTHNRHRPSPTGLAGSDPLRTWAWRRGGFVPVAVGLREQTVRPPRQAWTADMVAVP